MEKIVRQLEGYIKRILINEISREDYKGKIQAFINTLNDLIRNDKRLENIICIEFANRNNKIVIVRCSKAFCINKHKCHLGICSISDFIGYNPDASEYLFKKMEEKIDKNRPGYLKDSTLYDYIGMHLGNYESLFDVTVVSDHIILNEEIENDETSEIVNDYLLDSLKSMTTQEIKDKIHSDQIRNLINYDVESDLGLIKSMWDIFQEAQSHIDRIDTAPFDDRVKKDKNLLKFADCYQLSERECEILIKILEGYSSNDIENKLFLSLATIKNCIQNIFSKTGTHSRIELLALFNKFN